MENTRIENVTIEDVMSSNFGETGSVVRASFKKTTLTKQYETEVIEQETILNFDKELPSAEKMFISAVAKAQLEYNTYTSLLAKGLVTQSEFNVRKQSLEYELTVLKSKIEFETGINLDKYLKEIIK